MAEQQQDKWQQFIYLSPYTTFLERLEDLDQISAEDYKRLLEQLRQSVEERLSTAAEVIEETKKRIAEDITGVISDAMTALVNTLINVISLAGMPVGWGLGSFQIGVELGKRNAARQLEDTEIWIPDIQTTLKLNYSRFISNTEFQRLMKDHGVTAYWQNVLKDAFYPIPSEEKVIQLYREGKIDTATAFEFLRRHGYDETISMLLLSLKYGFLSPSDYISAWLRGFISEQQLDELLDKLGFWSRDRNLLKKLAFVIPSISDLIRMAVRDAFNPEVIRRFQLDQDYPELLTEYAKQQGLSEEWAKRYWYAHWELPSVTQAIEMFHRTVPKSSDPNADTIVAPGGKTRQNVIGRETFRMLLRTADISPFWRDKIEAISYAPLTRVDVRRAYDLGVIDEDDVYFAYRDLGYDDRNARILTQFTILEILVEERNRLRNELIELYEEGVLSEEELRNSLVLLNIRGDALQYLIEFAKYRKERKRIERLKKYYKAQFMRGDITDDEARDLLIRLGIEIQDAIQIVDEWVTEKIAKEKSLTKAEIKEAFKRKIIDEQKARDLLQRLGYSDESIDILLQLWR